MEAARRLPLTKIATRAIKRVMKTSLCIICGIIIR